MGATATEVDGGCAAVGGTIAGSVGGSDPQGGAHAGVTVQVPPGLSLTGVALQRTTTNVPADPSSGQSYVVKTAAGDLGDAGAGSAFSAPVAPGTPDQLLSIAVACGAAINQHCSGDPAGFSLSSMALTVADDSAPAAAYGGLHSPAAGTLHIDVPARDEGLGLRDATLTVDGQQLAQASYGGANCAPLAGGSGTDLALAEDCPHNGTTQLPLDTTGLADGTHSITITVSDAAGNSFNVLDNGTFEVLNHVDLGSNSQQLTIGTGANGGPGGGGTGTGTTPGTTSTLVGGANVSPCASPQLSAELSQKPLRRVKGVPEIAKGQRYRYTGRLTCVVNGKRVSAPANTIIAVENQVGKKKPLVKTGTTLRNAGRFTIILAYPSSRTIIFKYTGPTSSASVKVKVKVVKPKAKKSGKKTTKKK